MSFRDALNVFDLERMARRRLPAGVFSFIAGGAQDNRTLENNRAAFERIHFKPRGLVNVAAREQGVTLFGHRFASPFGIAPMGIAGMARFEADIALARAAARMNVPFVLSNMATVPMEAVARSCESAKWLQVYMPTDRERAARFVARAAAADFQALLVTIDVPVGANRENNLRSGFNLPLRLSPRLVADGLAHPRWFTGVLLRTLAATGIPRLENSAVYERPSVLASHHADLRAPGATIDWAFMRWLRDAWRRPLLIKGVLHEADAREALACGLDGVVVSNHGGRQLDGAASPMEVLPEVAAAAGDKLTVLADSGFRRGGDILKGLALGAKLVLCGRPMLYGAALGGEEGVVHALQLLRTEVDRDLALLGLNDVAEIAGAQRLAVGRQCSSSSSG